MSLSNREKSKDRSLDRPLMMIEKGLMYKQKIEEKRREKSMHETDDCTFAPQTNTKLIKELKDAPVAQRYNKSS